MIKIKNQYQITNELNDYIVKSSLRETVVLRELREITSKDEYAVMQIPPIQGQFLALLVKMIGAKKTIEIGTYTGYSALWVALALPSDGFTIACEINPDWGNVAKKYWRRAGVSDKIDLRIGPAKLTLEELVKNGGVGSFDFVFIDADKINTDKYYELSLMLVRKGGIIVIDNTLLYGFVMLNDITNEDLKDTLSLTPADVNSIKDLNTKLKSDNRIDLSLLPVADGLTLIRKR